MVGRIRPHGLPWLKNTQSYFYHSGLHSQVSTFTVLVNHHHLHNLHQSHHHHHQHHPHNPHHDLQTPENLQAKEWNGTPTLLGVNTF